ncbi:MAG: Sulfate/thiosulfate import ATP-binding protein CysA [Candidatus Celerinatantimonas neptuna]|nr:MAG: Sulfate/thiosulfate import ATP-binding protein CysA [Candidatus Celerinatantimonas neptuna]
MACLTIKDITKSFAGTLAVDNVSLDIEDGEFICLLGPSGSGKSTLLRILGGFEAPTHGQVFIDKVNVTSLAPEKLPTGMIFQSHALWSHMNVYQNIAFGLKLKGLSRQNIRNKVEHILELVGLSGYGERMTSQLSGGQQQRVAIARSLVLEPKILLLDEPFTSLDQHLREKLREEVREIQRRLKITTVFVTHGQDEALAIADRIVVLRNGKVEQVARANKIYQRPETQFVAGFIGAMNFLEGEIKGGLFCHPALNVDMPNVDDGLATLAIRPEAITLQPALAEENSQGTIHRVTHFGTHLIFDLTHHHELQHIKIMAPPMVSLQEGQRVNLTINDYHLFRNNLKIDPSLPQATHV